MTSSGFSKYMYNQGNVNVSTSDLRTVLRSRCKNQRHSNMSATRSCASPAPSGTRASKKPWFSHTLLKCYRLPIHSKDCFGVTRRQTLHNQRLRLRQRAADAFDAWFCLLVTPKADRAGSPNGMCVQRSRPGPF